MQALENRRKALRSLILRDLGLSLDDPRVFESQLEMLLHGTAATELPVDISRQTPLQDPDGIDFFVFGVSGFGGGDVF